MHLKIKKGTVEVELSATPGELGCDVESCTVDASKLATAFAERLIQLAEGIDSCSKEAEMFKDMMDQLTNSLSSLR